MNPISFGIIGGGWRAEFFLRVAQAAPQRFHLAGLAVRKAEKRDQLQARFGVRCFETPEQLIAQGKPQFVVVSVPRLVAPDMLRLCAAAGMPVLCETPPAANVEALGQLWRDCHSARIQIAEQYPFQPHHAARLALIASGAIGTPSYAHLSCCHGYHAMVLARQALRIGYENPVVSGREFKSPLIQGPDRAGPPTSESMGTFVQRLVTYDFGDKLVLYDFGGPQYMSYVRGRRILVRGDRGEVDGDQVAQLLDFATPINLHLERRQTGAAGDLDGYYLAGLTAGEQWVYRNPLPQARLNDDEIAVATCLLKMDEYVRTGTGFYSLAQASQDAYLELLANQTVATGQPITAQSQPWAG